MRKLIFSERKTKSEAARIGMLLVEVNKEAGLGAGYVSRKWGKDNVELETINRIADVIGCSPMDLLEEIEV